MRNSYKLCIRQYVEKIHFGYYSKRFFIFWIPFNLRSQLHFTRFISKLLISKVIRFHTSGRLTVIVQSFFMIMLGFTIDLAMLLCPVVTKVRYSHDILKKLNDFHISKMYFRRFISWSLNLAFSEIYTSHNS